MYNPWEIFHHVWLRHHKKIDGLPQIHFRQKPEHQQQYLQDESRAPRKNQILKHNSPMMPPSCLGARWILAYGKYGWPLYYP